MKLTRKFIMGSEFEKGWKALHLDYDDLSRLQKEFILKKKIDILEDMI